MRGLETVYKRHHKGRGEYFAILQNERGSFLRKYIGVGKKILDIGCRDGQLTSTYKEGNEVTGADIDAAALKRAEEKLGIQVLHIDLNDEWGISEKTYDVVVACEFLEHIYFPDLVCKKVKAVLKNDGLFVGTVPHAYSLQSRIKFLFGIKKGTPLEDPTHINHFSYKEFKKILELNFDSVKIEAYVPPRYRIIAKLVPYAFAHDLMFVAGQK